jgi:hypothetical protein
MNPIEDLTRWIQQYKDDEEPVRVGQAAAIKAMDYLLEVFSRQGDLKDGAVQEIKAAQAEVWRMLEILNAFHGKLHIIGYMHGIKLDDDDD